MYEVNCNANMAEDSTGDSCSGSDLRRIRAQWLSKFFIQDISSRVKCSEVLVELTSTFEGISKRECGFVVRECFPSVKRIHSNHVYYYSGIRRMLTTNENSNGVRIQVDNAQEKSSGHHQATWFWPSSGYLVHEIPRCMYINRLELLHAPDGIQLGTYKFANGDFNNLLLRYFRGYPVAVREYQTCIVNEAKTLLSLPSHHCFPELIGVCCDQKPYLLVTLFYGNVSKGVYMSLEGLLESDINDLHHWTTILLNVAQGLLTMHSCGFVHGDLKAENIILRKKQRSKLNMFVPVFLNLDKARPLDKTIHRNTYSQDYEMFVRLMERVILKINTKDSKNLSALHDVFKSVKMIPADSADLASVVTHLQCIATV